MKNSNTSSSLEQFGSFIRAARLNAGFSSLAKGIEAINLAITEENNKDSLARNFSRSTLHLIENGRIGDIDPLFLKGLATAYNLDYQEIIGPYLEERFTLPPNSLFQKAEGLEFISLSSFQELQSDIAKNSIVAVSSTSFLDDNLFFDMVCRNIKRGVKYYYHLQSNNELRYKSFVSDIAKKLNKDISKIDGHSTHFISRGISEFPLNAVLFIQPDKTIKGFIGLTLADQVACYQYADNTVSWRLYQAFLMAISLALEPEAQQMRLKVSRKLKEKKEVVGFPILLDNLE